MMLKGEGESIVVKSFETEFVSSTVKLPKYGAIGAVDVEESAEIADGY